MKNSILVLIFPLFLLLQSCTTESINDLALVDSSENDALKRISKSEQNSSTDLNSLIGLGASDSVILAALAQGADPWKQSLDRSQTKLIYREPNSPYYLANAFQAAISASRPDLAKQIATEVAKQKGDFNPDQKLGQIPSVVELATAQGSGLKFLSRNEQGGAITRLVPMKTYASNPGRSLQFRHATAVSVDGLKKLWLKNNGLKERDIASSITHTRGGRGSSASKWAEYVAQQQSKTLQFIKGNFGGNVNEILPYCLYVKVVGSFEALAGADVTECMAMTPTQIAAYTGNKTNTFQRTLFKWTIPGKYEAYVKAGGYTGYQDRFGNSASDYARSGGRFSGSDFNANSIVSKTGSLATPPKAEPKVALSTSSKSRNSKGGENAKNTESQANAGRQSERQQSTGFLVNENYTFSCPVTRRPKTIPIKARSLQCAAAQKVFARAASCNLIDEMEAAQRRYYAACASEIYGN